MRCHWPIAEAVEWSSRASQAFNVEGSRGIVGSSQASKILHPFDLGPSSPG